MARRVELYVGEYAEAAMDAITVLKHDHRNVERLFQRYERTTGAAERRRIADEIVRELSVHATIEEQLVYPRIKQALNGPEGVETRTTRPRRNARGRNGRASSRRAPVTGEHRVLLALEEHHFTKVALAEIERLPATDARFDPKMRVLAKSVIDHIEEEERELLRPLERALTAQELDELGDLLQRAKKLAPTRPHPSAPDEPPANLIAGAAASAYDRGVFAMNRVLAAGRDTMRRAFQAGAEMAGRARRNVRQTAKDARDVARTARDAARSAREDAREMARDAADVARQSAATA